VSLVVVEVVTGVSFCSLYSTHYLFSVEVYIKQNLSIYIKPNVSVRSSFADKGISLHIIQFTFMGHSDSIFILNTRRTLLVEPPGRLPVLSQTQQP